MYFLLYIIFYYLFNLEAVYTCMSFSKQRGCYLSLQAVENGGINKQSHRFPHLVELLLVR